MDKQPEPRDLISQAHAILSALNETGQHWRKFDRLIKQMEEYLGIQRNDR